MSRWRGPELDPFWEGYTFGALTVAVLWLMIALWTL
jgi:hypothetical protein